jgi:hypothetical protein
VRRAYIVLALLATAGACNGTSTSPPPASDFSVAVTSPNESLFLGATEQMTASASDGRILTGTWGSDNTAVAAVNGAGLVTAVSSGLANVFFVAEGRQGTKPIRTLPNFAGTYTGNYAITSCVATGAMAAANVCGTAPPGSLVPYTFVFTQGGAVLTGRVLILGVEAIPAFAATIGAGGDVTVIGTVIAPGGYTVHTTWQIAQRTAGVTTGTIGQLWTAPGVSGQTTVAGTINTMVKAASVGE